MTSVKLLAVSILVSLSLVWGLSRTASAALNAANLSRSELQQAIVEGLAAGRDVSDLLHAFERHPAPRSPTPAVPRRTTAADLRAQLQTFLQALTRATQTSFSDASLTALTQVYEHVQAAHMMMTASFQSVQQRLTDSSVPERFQTRREDAQTHYAARLEQSLAPLAASMAQLRQSPDQTALITSASFKRELQQAVRETVAVLPSLLKEPPQPILRNQTLPVRRAAFTPRSLTLEPAIQPAYLQPEPPQPDAADFAGSADTPLTAEIVAQAEALHYDSVQIYEFVRNHVRTEWYAGAMKGAVGTLRQKSGNTIDQASLLIALLRASSVPARYVHGVIRLPIEPLMSSLGMHDATQAIRALNTSGTAYRPVIQGGQVGAVDLESTWVTAYVPYTNYRGTLVDASGPLWIPLTPALKDLSGTPATAILSTMGMSVEALLTDYLAQPQSLNLQSYLQQRVIDYLQATGHQSTYSEQLGERHIEPVHLGLLPSTLPVSVRAVTAESPVLDDAYRHKLRLVVRAGTQERAPIILDHTVAVAEVASQRLTVSYIPASVEDQRVTQLYGGLDNVPAYLIQLRPQLKLNGRLLAVATDGIDAGSSYLVELELVSPAGREHVSQTLTAGSYHAIGITAQGAASGPDDLPRASDTEFLAAALLHRVGLDYSVQWTASETEFAGLLDVAMIRPWPSVVVVSNAIQVETIAGQPHRLSWQGVTLDAALRLSTPMARRAGGQAETDWLRLSALQGSILEHQIIERLFLVESISADRGLQLARQRGPTVYRLDAQTIAAIRPTLSHPPEVLDAITHWVGLGLIVDVPAGPIAYQDWRGSVWRVEDPASGAAGYFISGGLAGGFTSTYPTRWALQLLRDALSAPNTGQANQDPHSAASITKLPATDAQTGVVGEPLLEPLTVYVRDAKGAPVNGARVTFSVTVGSGSLGGTIAGAAHQSQGPGSTIEVETDGRGLASVDFVLGQKTDTHPVYIKLQPKDAHLTQATRSLIEATVVNADGRQLRIAAPFTALAYPDVVAGLKFLNVNPPDDLENPSVSRTAFGFGRLNGRMFVAAVDQYDNPVSNVNVRFEAPRQPWAPIKCGQMSYLPTHFVGPKNSDRCRSDGNWFVGECGSPTYTDTTTVTGTYAGIIAAQGTRKEMLTISAPDYPAVSPLLFSYAIDYRMQFGDNVCPGERACSVQMQRITNPFGYPLNAALVGTQAPYPVGLSLLCYSDEKGFHPSAGDGEVVGKAEWWVKRGDDVRFVEDGCGAATNCIDPNPFQYTGNGRYQARISTHPRPGHNRVWATIYEDEDQEIKLSAHRMDGVTGLRLTITRFTSFGVPNEQRPDVIYLDAENKSRYYAQLTYNVEPADYQGQSVDVRLFQEGTLHQVWKGSGLSGAGVITIPRGTAFDPSKTYEAEVVVNRHTPFEVRSERFPLPVRPKLLVQAEQLLYVRQDIDVINERSCVKSNDFTFELSAPARVSLVFAEKHNSSQTLTVIDDQVFPRGSHRLPFYLPVMESMATPDVSLYTVQPGQYVFALTAVDPNDTQNKDAALGSALVEYTTNKLPVARTLVNGVDVSTGNLLTSTVDLEVPGRGLPLAFRRTYSSNSSSVPGPLGVGWHHNYGSGVIKDACGGAIVAGGAGDGSRFVEAKSPSGETAWVPLKGYHGTLLYDAVGDTFDFFSPDGTQYHYRNFGRPGYDLEFISDPNGNATKLGYDPANLTHAKLLTVEDPAGRRFWFTYEERTFNILGIAASTAVMTKIEAPEGQELTFEYDANGHLIRAAREGDARVEHYTYTPDRLLILDTQTRMLTPGKLATYTDPNSATTTYTYGDSLYTASAGVSWLASGKQRRHQLLGISYPYTGVAEIDIPASGTTTFTYDIENKVTTVTNGRTLSTTYTMDPTGAVISVKNPLGHDTTTTWLEIDRVPETRTNGRGITTEYSYDADGNLLSAAVGGTTVSYSYVQLGGGTIKNRVATRTDRNGNLAQFAYDSQGNVLKITDPEGGTTEHTYAANGDRLSTQDPNGHLTRYEYDDYGYVKKVVKPLGAVTETIWDGRGRASLITEPMGQTFQQSYDTLNRMISRIDPLGQEQAWAYDAIGNILSETDQAGRTTSYNYDAASRRTGITNALNDTQRMTYDAQGNKTSETDFRGHLATFDYDAGDRLVKRTEPLGRETQWSLDAVGNVLGETDALGRTTQFDYDPLDRRIKTTDALDGVNRTVYDDEGNRVEQSDANLNRTTMVYDKLNRLTDRVEPLGRATRYTYDGNGNRTSETDAKGHTTWFDYDKLNRRVTRTDAMGQETVMRFDAAGNLTQEINARLYSTTHEYDPLNRRIKTTDAAGFVTAYGYDEVGNRTLEELPNGNVITSDYDDLNRLTQQEDALGPLAHYTYDPDGNRTEETDANGQLTVNRYDALNQLIQQNLPASRSRLVIYDAVGNSISETDANHHTTLFDYDSLNRLTTRTDALGSTTERTYDAVGNIRSETDRRQNTTTYTYDALNQVIETTDALNQTMTDAYDAVGQKQSETDKRGTQTIYAYDKVNRLISVKRAGVTQQTRKYDAVGNVILETDANQNTTAWIYDPRNLLIRQSQPLAAITSHTYDAIGDRIESRDPESRLTTRLYDQRRRLLTETTAAGTTAYRYDGNGNRTSLERPNHNTWRYTYNAANRLTGVTDPIQATTTYTYDGNGNRLSQSDANGNPTTFTYDALNRMMTAQYADSATAAYDYDATGNRIVETDANGQTMTHVYDALNRLVQTDYPSPRPPSGDDVQQITYAYDSNGNLVQVIAVYSGATGTRLTTRTYDAFDRLIDATNADHQTLTYSYDAQGNRLTVGAPGGRVARYSYDALNRMDSVTASQGVAEYGYDRSSRLTRIAYPTGTQSTQAYDPAGRIGRIAHTHQGASISTYAYDYDDNSNRTQQRVSRGGVDKVTRYRYDLTDRLHEVAYPDQTTSYTYDAVSNRLTEQRISATDSHLLADRTYTYNGRNQVMTLSDELDPSATTTFTYDANGNRTTRKIGDVTTTYTFDARNQLRRLTQGGSSLGEFLYDWQGLRVRKQTPTDTHRYVYDNRSVLLITDDDSNLHSYYLYGRNGLVSLNHVTEGPQFYLFDALGSVVGLSRPDGSIQSRYEYDAWGNERFTVGSSTNRFGFTGHEHDSEMGLYYAKARYYDPVIGLFLSADPVLGDPLTPLSLHRYLYAYQNPTVYIDPNGEESISKYIDQGAEGCGFWGCLGLALTKGLYHTATAGFAAIHDPIADARDEGRVTTGQYWTHGVGGGLSVAGVNALTGRVGGALAANASTLSGRLVLGAASGAISGAADDIVNQGALVGAGLQDEFRVSQTLRASATGAAIGGAGSTVANAVEARHFHKLEKAESKPLWSRNTRDDLGRIGPTRSTTVAESPSEPGVGASKRPSVRSNPLLSTGDEQLDAQIRDLRDELDNLGVDTPKDKALLWTGDFKEARKLALLEDKVMLNMTTAGKYLEGRSLLGKIPAKVEYQLWNDLSERFALSATGQITVLRSKVNVKSIFNWTEHPIVWDRYRNGIDQIRIIGERNVP